MRRLAALLVLLLAPVMWLGAEPAFACSCAPRTVPEHVQDADAAAVARVVARDHRGRRIVYTFRTEQRLEGGVPSRFEVRTAAQGSMCGLTGLVIGRRYVVFLTSSDEGFATSLCSGTGPATAAYLAEVESATRSGGAHQGAWPPAVRRLVAALDVWG